ncbi:S-layer homology domain-containing protein [Cohnella silvisoli]|uniref:S-layer homology domain-containing protein n=1 Tax=Cohnella silvisoli TaxID=2873699 RepID=A0ABV1KS03_9BACL|nr:S-layer homology domain-containing protein [Cohnella silvisoli]MCD9024643.1 S-layer homology domain-containing protein [Cohnella silvisoli]
MNYLHVKKLKKIILGILAVSVLIAAIFQPNRAVFADVFVGFDGGTGTAGDPYLISSAVQFNEIRSYVTSSFKLAADIDLSDYANWVPIGNLTLTTRFKGSLDGDGHTITNLAINRPTTNYVGLFGYVYGGTIKNLRIAGANITGQNNAGVLAGRIEGIFEGQQSKISNVGSSGGSLTGGSSVGGLIGDSLRGMIDNSYSSVRVTGTGFSIGGLIGVNGQGTISHSYAIGDVISPAGNQVGGLVGANSSVSLSSPQSLISNSYATGEVKGNNYVGGLLGRNDSNGLASSNTVVSDSYAIGKVTGIDKVGGLVGYNNNGTINNDYALGEVIGTTQVGGLVGQRATDTIRSSYYDKETTKINDVSDFSRSTQLMKTLSNFLDWDMNSTWKMDSGINNGYPYLPAPSLSAVAAIGQEAGTTSMIATASAGNHLVVQVSSSTRAMPGFGHAVPTSGVLDPYVSGSDIGGVDATTNKYVSVYEANRDNKVVKFTQIMLQSDDILNYTIDELQNQSLTPLMVGYVSGTQAANTITITSTGTGDLANLSTDVSGDAFDITQPAISLLDSTTPSTTFTVQTKDGLAVGTYTETVTISADHLSDATFTISQVVSAPGAPVLQPPIASNGQVTLNWSAVGSVTGYSVFMSTTSGSYGTAEATVTSTTFSYNATGLSNGTNYYFTVRANNNGADGAASNEVSATPKTIPEAPTAVTATTASGQATIDFFAPANDGGSSITSYTVIASPGNQRATGATSPIVITGLSNGTSYTFTVIATNSEGNSPPSAPSSAVTHPIGVPVLQAPTIGDAQLTLNWGAVNDVTGYQIYKSTVPGTYGAAVDSVSSNTHSYTVTGLRNGTTYYFTIRAMNGVIEGAASNEEGAIPVRWSGPGAPLGTFAGGIGIEEDPYLIANAAQLDAVRHYRTGAYKLIADIDLSSYANADGWVPIGTGDLELSFSGMMDGNGYSITGLKMNRPTADNVGLFGYVTGNITNLKLDDVDIIGKDFVGGIAGFVKYGTISNSKSSGAVTGNNDVGGLVGRVYPGTINNSYNTGSVTGYYRVGGLVGHNVLGTISDSYATGNVTGITASFYIGGLVGQNEGVQGTIRNSYASGNVTADNQVGGLVGLNILGRIETSYSTGNVNAKWYTGGLVGVNQYGTIKDSYTKSSVNGQIGKTGGFIGQNAGADITNTYAAGNVTGGSTELGAYTGSGITMLPNSNYYDSDKIGLVEIYGALPKTTILMKTLETYSGWDFTQAWGLDSTINDGYPYLRYLAPELQATAVPGNTAGTTKVTAEAGFGNQLVIQVSSGNTTKPSIRNVVPESGVINPYVPGSDIGGVDAATNKYVAVYEVDNENQVVKFAQITLTSNEIHPSYTIEQLDDQMLAALTVGYASGTQETKTVAVTRTGTEDLASLAVTISGTEFELTQPLVTTLNSGTPSTSFTVKAKDGLAAGTYTATVTVSATNMTDATFTVTQVVNPAPTYTIAAIADQTPAALTAGYAAGTQETKTLAITRTGTGNLVNLAVAVSGTEFELTQPLVTTLNSGTPSTNFTVKAKDGLAAGTHTATVTVSATNMTDATFTVTQVVNQARIPIDPPSTTIIQPSPTIIQPTRTTIDLGNENTGATLHVKAEVETSVNGATSTNVAVDPEQFVQMLDSIKSKKATAQTVTVAVEGKVDQVHVAIPIVAIWNESGAKTNGTLIIETDLANYHIPLSLLREKSANHSEGNILITINKSSGQLHDSIYKAAERQDLLLLNNPIEFKIAIGNQEMIEFGDVYVERTVSLGSKVDPSKATAVWYDPATETFHFVPSIFKEIDGVTNVVMKSPHNSIYTLVQSDETFLDLNGHWAKDDIEKLASKLIVRGKSGTEFAPEVMITRAEFVALLVRSLGITVNAEESSFKDVQKNAWFADEVEAAVKAELIRGFTDGTFRPEDLITREQMANIMAAALKFVDNQPEKSEYIDNLLERRFSDADKIHTWARDAAAISVKAGIISGRTETTFAPAATATRAEAVAMLGRMLRYIQFIN